MTFLDRVYARAREAGARIVLPEADDPRVRAAAARIAREGLGTIVPLPAIRPDLIAYVRGRRPDKFPTDAAAGRALAHPLVRGAALVGIGAADVMVGGAHLPTADTVRAALWTVGPASGVATISSAFYMMHGDRVLTFADCAVCPAPTADQLADIAYAAACDRRRIVGDEPVVAFLSYSTEGSAEGESVERVRAAVGALARRLPGGG
ncbi:MAG: phosphate acyltransferase, partial [Gemmatimonadales bacterium]